MRTAVTIAVLLAGGPTLLQRDGIEGQARGHRHDRHLRPTGSDAGKIEQPTKIARRELPFTCSAPVTASRTRDLDALVVDGIRRDPALMLLAQVGRLTSRAPQRVRKQIANLMTIH